MRNSSKNETVDVKEKSTTLEPETPKSEHQLHSALGDLE